MPVDSMRPRRGSARRVAVDPDDGATHLLLAQVAVRRLDAARSPGRTVPRGLGATGPGPPRPGPRLRSESGRHAPGLPGPGPASLAALEEAEAAWLEALRISPTAPEAGWYLLELYYIQGRQEEARRLALRLYEVEPDPHDRVRLLLELLRPDARPPAPGSIAMLLEPVVRQNSHDLHSAIALGLAMVRNGELDRGLDLLRPTVERHPENPVAWEAWLTGLDDGGRIDELGAALDRIPPALAADPRFARFRGRVAQERHDWRAAAGEYRRGLRHDPHDAKLRYRLALALRGVGASAEAEPLERDHRAYQAALIEARPLYEEANAIKTLGVEPHPDLCRRLADIASAWAYATSSGLVSTGSGRPAERSGQPGCDSATRYSQCTRGCPGRNPVHSCRRQDPTEARGPVPLRRGPACRGGRSLGRSPNGGTRSYASSSPSFDPCRMTDLSTIAAGRGKTGSRGWATPTDLSSCPVGVARPTTTRIR